MESQSRPRRAAAEVAACRTLCPAYSEEIPAFVRVVRSHRAMVSLEAGPNDFRVQRSNCLFPLSKTLCFSKISSDCSRNANPRLLGKVGERQDQRSDSRLRCFEQLGEDDLASRAFLPSRVGEGDSRKGLDPLAGGQGQKHGEAPGELLQWDSV